MVVNWHNQAPGREPMVQRHPSTPDQREQWATSMLTHAGQYGFVTGLSRQIGASRQTLYTWRDTAANAIREAFALPRQVSLVTPALERRILTVLTEGHASE